MSSLIRKKHLSSLQSHLSQPEPVCTWSAHAPQPGSISPYPRIHHALSATATVTGELFLFGGYTDQMLNKNIKKYNISTNDLYVISTRDFSITLLKTNGEIPSPRGAHGAVLTSTSLLIWGGRMGYFSQGGPLDDSLHLLNLVSRKWTRIVTKGPGPCSRYYHTVTMVGSKFFVFGGETNMDFLNDMWALDLNSLNSQPVWESYEPTPGNEKPCPRISHVSVTTEDHIIVFGGYGNEGYRNDTWSFNISTRKWTELQCTGSIPSPRVDHAAVLVDDVMFVFGGYTGYTYSDELYALQLSTQRWFNFHNMGKSPLRRSAHAMASDGTRVSVHGGNLQGARADEISLIHDFDTKDIKYPELECNAVDPNEKTTGVNSNPRRVPEDDASEGSTEYDAKSATPHSSSEGDITRLEVERQLSISLAAQTERDQRIAQLTDELEQQLLISLAKQIEGDQRIDRLTDKLERQLSISLAAQTEWDQRIARLTEELTLKSALLEEAEANAAEASKRAGLELREHADRLLMQTSLAKQRDAELVDIQARLDELLLSRDQQIGKYEKELANVRAKFDAKESELEAVRLRLTDAAKGWTKSKAEADTIRSQTATGSMNRNEDQVACMLVERVRDIEANIEAIMASKWWNEKSIEETECRNEGDMEYSKEG